MGKLYLVVFGTATELVLSNVLNTLSFHQVVGQAPMVCILFGLEILD